MAGRFVDVIRCFEPEVLNAAMRGPRRNIATPLRAGPFRVDVTTIELPRITAQATSATPLVALAAMRPDTALLHLPMAGRDTLLINGSRVPAHGIALYGGGGEFSRANEQVSSSASISMPMELAEQMLCPPGRLPWLGPGTHQLVDTSSRAWTRLARMLGMAAEIAANAPAELQDPAAREGLQSSLLDAARQVLADAHPGQSRRGSRTRQSWLRLVQQVDAYLEASPGRPIYSEELCDRLGASVTGLADAFRNVLGVTPHRYLKLRRLAMVRAALSAQEGAAGLVKSVALAHGFWHLGQFAQDYRRMYAETPAETLARAQGRRAATGRGERASHLAGANVHPALAIPVLQ